MRTRSAFNPRPQPRLVTSQTVSKTTPGGTVGVNPDTPPIPPLSFDQIGSVRNLGAILTALKDAMESLTGQRGDPANRAVTFKDLVNYGVLTPQALTSAGGNTPLAVIPAYFTPADPGGSSVAPPGIMMGTKCVFAVGINGAFLVGASGYCASGGSVGSLARIEVRVGTDDPPPENGEAPRGNLIGVPITITEVAAGARMNWAFTGVGLNYIPLTPVWLDFTLATDSGTALMGSINVTTLGV
jgi:hypothetical protein